MGRRGATQVTLLLTEGACGVVLSKHRLLRFWLTSGDPKTQARVPAWRRPDGVGRVPTAIRGGRTSIEVLPQPFMARTSVERRKAE